MGIEKAELKLAVLHDLGLRVDDMLDAAERDLHIQTGATKAFTVARQRADEHRQLAVKAEVELGELSPDQLARLQKYYSRIDHVLANLAVTAEIRAHQLRGKTESSREIVSLLKKLHDEEVPKAQPPAPAQPRMGTHPGKNVAQLRKKTRPPAKLKTTSRRKKEDDAKNPPLRGSG